MGVEGINPKEVVGTYVKPKEWNALVEEPEVLVVDTRNDSDVEIGSFKNAIDPQTKTFRDFPNWAEKNLAIGSVVIRVRTGVPRCQVVGFNPKEGKRDQDIMKALVKYRAKVNLPDGLLPDYATPGFATYAEVIKEGIITIGDKVEFVE